MAGNSAHAVSEQGEQPHQGALPPTLGWPSQLGAGSASGQATPSSPDEDSSGASPDDDNSQEATPDETSPGADWDGMRFSIWTEPADPIEC